MYRATSLGICIWDYEPISKPNASLDQNRNWFRNILKVSVTEKMYCEVQEWAFYTVDMVNELLRFLK